MSINFDCPVCEAKLRAPWHQEGKRIDCPQCRQIVPVPSQDPANHSTVKVRIVNVMPFWVLWLAALLSITLILQIIGMLCLWFKPGW